MMNIIYDLKQLKDLKNKLSKYDYTNLIRIGMRSAMIKAEEIVIDKYLSAPGRGPGVRATSPPTGRAGTKNPYKDKLRRDTGGAATSIRTKTKTVGKSVLGLMSSDKGYLAAHEFGATIPERRPRRAKVLTIPLPDGTVIYRKRAKGFTLPARAPLRHGIEEAFPSMKNILDKIIRKNLAKNFGFKL